MVKAALHIRAIRPPSVDGSLKSQFNFRFMSSAVILLNVPRAIFITQQTPAYCIFLLSLLPNNTSFYYLSRMSETLFPISRRAPALYTHQPSISPASAHFYCGRWCSHFELLCSLAHTHITRPILKKQFPSDKQRDSAQWIGAAAAFHFRTPPHTSARLHLDAAWDVYIAF